MPYSRTAYRMAFFEATPVYSGAATNPSSVPCRAVFKRRYVNDGDTNDHEGGEGSVSVTLDLLAAPATQVTVAAGGGVTVTHAQLAALIRKACEQAGGL